MIMSQDVSALPSELLVTPLPLIGFCGLDITKNAVHKSIWDAFDTNRKADRAAIQFKLLPRNYEFPRAKPKRSSYEWYQPKGILKRNWMLKHLHMIPAVVVVFQEIEWDDSEWSEKQMQCISLIQKLRTALQDRNTFLCLVILQKANNAAPGENIVLSERMASVISACNMNSKMMFTLPLSDHLMGYILRLESAFLDMAHSYYSLMSRQIRAHKEQLQTSHITLKIRYQFKLGFVAEIRQDFSTSLKHYSQSYANLDEIQILDSNCLEVKTIAGFLSYKICNLMFKLRVPRDSINHFISHIEKYKNCVGCKDLVFEHYTWLSTQHCVFAELFCEAIRNGLPALQTQHPGIYYQKAAEYAIKRKEASLQSSSMLSHPSSDSNIQTVHDTMSISSKYFGIRTVKTGEPTSEQLYTLINSERAFNHSGAIINLLGLAMAQFKVFKCLRFRKKIAVDMAEEYLKSGEHAKALTLYSLMLPDYRQENWSPIFSNVLLQALHCALLAASVIDYVSCSLESLSIHICRDRNSRIMVLENLWKVFQGVPPVSQYQTVPELCDLWNNVFTSVKSPIRVVLDNMSDLFNIRATFQHAKVKNDELLNIFVILKVLTDVPIKINNISILLADSTRTYKLESSKYIIFHSLSEFRNSHKQDFTILKYNVFETNLKLSPERYYEFVFTTGAQQFLENTELRVLSTELEMGSNKLSILLSRNTVCNPHTFRYHNRCKDIEDNLAIIPLCNITPTFHLNIQNNCDKSNILMNEYCSVTTIVYNCCNAYFRNVGLNISVPNHLRNKVFLTPDILVNRQKLYSEIQIDIGELSVHNSITASFYIFSLIEATVALQQKVWYTLDLVHPKKTASSLLCEQTTPKGYDNLLDKTQPLSICKTNNAGRGSASDSGSLSNNHKLGLFVSPISIEYLDEGRQRKILENIFQVKCELEFKLTGRFYTLNKTPMRKIFCGENFLFRINMEAQADCDLDMLETYFICDHNLGQSTYTLKRKNLTNKYRKGDKFEEVILLYTNAALHDWVTPIDLERSESVLRQSNLFRRFVSAGKQCSEAESVACDNQMTSGVSSNSASSSQMNKNLLAKIPSNVTIINNTPTLNSFALNGQSSILNSSVTSEDNKISTATPGIKEVNQLTQTSTTRLVFNKAMEAIQATGHCRGFIKGVVTVDPEPSQPLQSNQTLSNQNKPVFGVYCVKWRRHGLTAENESKFVIYGVHTAQPPLNIFCSIEEKMYIKMPMTFRVLLRNRTAKTLHLIATLIIGNTDNFICSGHKQLDISLFAYADKELIYNLYPLCVGWQNLPELTLEYNTHSDPKNPEQNSLLGELVERSMPKSIFVLPPLKQHAK